MQSKYFKMILLKKTPFSKTFFEILFFAHLKNVVFLFQTVHFFLKFITD